VRILITGSEGLIGRNLRETLVRDGHHVLGYDIKAKVFEEKGNIKNFDQLQKVLPETDGIVHLAGVSRVIDGEKDPEECMRTNVEGTKYIIRAALAAQQRPWILFSSSREVYGEPSVLPVPDTADLKPVNVYGESKVMCEKMILDARQGKLVTGIVRLSNVYGDTQDHSDRVIPAFCRTAAMGGQIRVEGGKNTFDFTHIDDTVRGIVSFIHQLAQHRNLPPIPLLTGKGTTLEDLAKLAVKCGDVKCSIVEYPSRSFDVSKFYGVPIYAEKYLNWSAKIGIEEGVQRFVNAFKAVPERISA